MIKSVTISEGQTVEDLSLQIYGTVERVFDIIELIGVDNISSKIDRFFTVMSDAGKCFSNTFLVLKTLFSSISIEVSFSACIRNAARENKPDPQPISKKDWSLKVLLCKIVFQTS